MPNGSAFRGRRCATSTRSWSTATCTSAACFEWIEHDEIGRIVVPSTPLRIHGADPVDTVPSPKLGQHNCEIYDAWLGLSAADIATLEQDNVI